MLNIIYLPKINNITYFYNIPFVLRHNLCFLQKCASHQILSKALLVSFCHNYYRNKIALVLLLDSWEQKSANWQALALPKKYVLLCWRTGANVLNKFQCRFAMLPMLK